MHGVKISNHKAWLYKVTLNCGKKSVKEKIRRNKYDFEDNEKKEYVLENILQYNPDYIENMVTDKEIEKQAVKIISSLSNEEQILYIEYYCKHRKIKDIAQTTNVSSQTLKKRHQRLKKKINKQIKKFEKF